MATSQAHVATANAQRYLNQLCSHWSHKFTVEVQLPRGSIDFGDGQSCTLEAGATHLEVGVTAPPDRLEQLQQVVAAHINRFAHREGELEFDWKPQPHAGD
ncbi:DUF2218 domain-containing protein [Sandaracinobacter sp. RS1-74]|uniref:DUF2218 domain-containing protein n=1 Tax=Sandaracinobacteroides sayramensis TaxID=2913411 RepID=UPI001EDA6FAB|nr:DUF2218 domain-containing protein [Sandaracinobacteroides sayramensis]MCG2840338.1 DUF2218 domain-containing protein [Sandaracinobacteroides sayramensis]